MHRHFRDRLLDRWGRLVTRRPKLTLVVCGLLAVVSIVTAITTIQMKADRNALISEDLPWAHRYATYRADFPRWDDVIICLEGDPLDASIDTLARDLAKHLNTPAALTMPTPVSMPPKPGLDCGASPQLNNLTPRCKNSQPAD